MKKVLVLFTKHFVFISILFLGVSANVFADKSFGNKLVHIPGGDYNMGCSIGDKNCGDDEGPLGSITVMVPAFHIN